MTLVKTTCQNITEYKQEGQSDCCNDSGTVSQYFYSGNWQSSALCILIRTSHFWKLKVISHQPCFLQMTTLDEAKNLKYIQTHVCLSLGYWEKKQQQKMGYCKKDSTIFVLAWHLKGRRFLIAGLWLTWWHKGVRHLQLSRLTMALDVSHEVCDCQKWPSFQCCAKLESCAYYPAVVHTQCLIRQYQQGECREYASCFKDPRVISVSLPSFSDERWELVSTARCASPLWLFSGAFFSCHQPTSFSLQISQIQVPPSKLKIPGNSVTLVVFLKVAWAAL